MLFCLSFRLKLLFINTYQQSLNRFKYSHKHTHFPELNTLLMYAPFITKREKVETLLDVMALNNEKCK